MPVRFSNADPYADPEVAAPGTESGGQSTSQREGAQAGVLKGLCTSCPYMVCILAVAIV